MTKFEKIVSFLLQPVKEPSIFSKLFQRAKIYKDLPLDRQKQ
jgi:hypothetical protein